MPFAGVVVAALAAAGTGWETPLDAGWVGCPSTVSSAAASTLSLPALLTSQGCLNAVVPGTILQVPPARSASPPSCPCFEHLTTPGLSSRVVDLSDPARKFAVHDQKWQFLSRSDGSILRPNAEESAGHLNHGERLLHVDLPPRYHPRTPPDSPWSVCCKRSFSLTQPVLLPRPSRLTMLLVPPSVRPAARLRCCPCVDTHGLLTDYGFLVADHSTEARSDGNAMVPSAPEKPRVWLHLRGVSYFATVSINSVAVSPVQAPATTRLQGMFHRWSFDLGRLPDLAREVVVAVRVEPPEYPGGGCHACDHPPCVPCGQGGDHQIARNAAMMQFMAGRS